MARAIWSGSISFGLVNVAVKAYSAVRDHEVHFHQIDKRSGERVRYNKVSQRSNRKVDADDIELGFEVGKGRYVTFEKEELEALKPRSTRTIEVTDFVALAAIDPIYYERTYWLAPDGPGAAKAYTLLCTAMEQSELVGIGSVVMRNKQYLTALRPLDGAMAMSTLRFADEVVPRSDIPSLPARRGRADAKELHLAKQIIDALQTAWKPSNYHDTYTEALRDRIARRSKGETIVVDESPAETAKMLDLMTALSASVDAAKQRRRGDVTKAFERAARELSDSGGGDGQGPTKPRRRTARTTSDRRGTRRRATRSSGAAKRRAS